MFCDEDEQPFQGKQADSSSSVIGISKKVHEDGWLWQVWDNALVNNEKGLLVDDSGKRESEKCSPAVGKNTFMVKEGE
jgi:hypothetical protein